MQIFHNVSGSVKGGLFFASSVHRDVDSRRLEGAGFCGVGVVGKVMRVFGVGGLSLWLFQELGIS